MVTSQAILELGPDFFDPVTAAVFPRLKLRYRNQEAAQQLGLDALSPADWQRYFGEFHTLPDKLPHPLALRYHGHQFLHYNPELGDGRGFLYAQFQTAEKLLDLGTKGSGQTPYSRKGDGRLTLKGAFREILATELLESYGVNTSKSFSVFETGEQLERSDEPSPTRAAVLVRLCHSHIRFGSFQRLAHLNQNENIHRLTEYCLRHFFKDITLADPTERASAFLFAVVKKSADLVASWMTCGFIHGVMNTDNMNITGECFDYGPYRFMPAYNSNFTAAYFDHQGLYRYARQPITMSWNLEQLAKSLQVGYPNILISEALDSFGEHFNASIRRHFLRRLNLNSIDEETDQQLLSVFFHFLETEKPLFEQTFFDLHSGLGLVRLDKSPQAKIYHKESFADLSNQLKKFVSANKDLEQHPYYKQSQACSLLIDEIEALWSAIATEDDWTPFENKLAQIRSLRAMS